MKNHFKKIIVLSLLPLALGATSLPQASSKTVINLQNFLKYDFQAKINITCKEKSALYICESHNQSITETDENNVISTVSFKKLQFHFNTNLSTELEKKQFAKTMQEIKNTNEAMQKASNSNNYEPILTPLEDELNRAMFENLTHISIDGFDAKNSEPKSHITVKNITYNNTMKKTAKGVSFDERIFGKIELLYTHALIDTNETTPFYEDIPMILESWFETNNEKRAKYVSKKLHELYADESISPLDGMIVLDSKYIGNDTMSILLKADNDNHNNTSGNFEFSGDLQQISTIFKPAKGALVNGMPDFLFKSLKLHSYNKADTYRHLINNDKKLATYVGEYTKLIHKHFDTKVQAFTSNAKLITWFEDAKVAFSKIIQGEADRLDIIISNKKGATAMQLFGIVMGKMMQAPKKGATQATQEEVVADIVTQELELNIKAY
jgi:hypothetical protein